MEELALPYERDLRDYLDALMRRRRPMMFVGALVFCIAAVVAVVLPPVYRSAATILIEEQEIPQDLVRSTVSSYADQRIQIISQQVMTRATLMKIVEKYDLYTRDRRFMTTEEVLERLRKDIKLDLVNSDVTDRRGGGRTSATIAFTLSYDGETPDRAQKVANELTSLYLNENLHIRQQKAAETSSFLAEEAERLSGHIRETEGRLAEFKQRNLERLPELTQVNMQMRERADGELRDIDRQLASIEERRFYLEAQLSQIKPNLPLAGLGGERVLEPEDRLRSLRAQYASMSGTYADTHPDMVRARQQIEALEREVGTDADASKEIEGELARLRSEVAAMRDRYADDHPDIQRMQARMHALEKRLVEPPRPAARSNTRKPENPAYLTFNAQLESLRAEAHALEKKRTDLQARMGQLDARLTNAPTVEREYADLSRDLENSLTRYREIKAKLMQAEVAQELEKDRKSERFSLIDPPPLPEKPRSPNRPMIVLIGLGLALGASLGTFGLLEAIDDSIRNSRELAAMVAAPLLSVIPYVGNRTDRDVARRRRRRIRMLWLVGVVGGLAAIHFLWMPLDVFWFSMMRRLQLG